MCVHECGYISYMSITDFGTPPFIRRARKNQRSKISDETILQRNYVNVSLLIYFEDAYI